MSGETPGGDRPALSADSASSRRGRAADAATDDRERFLDLAAFAEGRLDPGCRARIAALLERDPDAASDVAAARLALATAAPEPAPARVIARAARLIDTPQNVIVRFSERRRTMFLQPMARWASLAAAVAVASWLGFTLGVDTSQSIAQAGIHAVPAVQDGVLRDLFDPSTAFMRDLTGGTQT